LRLRRFLISDPRARGRLAVAGPSRHVGPRDAAATVRVRGLGASREPSCSRRLASSRSLGHCPGPLSRREVAMCGDEMPGGGREPGQARAPASVMEARRPARPSRLRPRARHAWRDDRAGVPGGPRRCGVGARPRSSRSPAHPCCHDPLSWFIGCLGSFSRPANRFNVFSRCDIPRPSGDVTPATRANRHSSSSSTVPAAGGSAAGSCSRNIAPPPGAGPAHTAPCSSWATCATMASPRPEPGSARAVLAR